nr:unnamed protein product [Haemonchus contortus]
MAAENDVNQDTDGGINSRQTDVAHIRGVLKELPRNVQRRRVEPGNDEEKMETDENGPIEKTDAADWSALRASLETAFGTIGGSNRNVRNRMDFLGAVKIAVELEEGNKVDVAFHIADDKEAKILLGTNALGKLGIQVVLPPQEPTLQAEASERVVVARRMYIPPYGKALVSARHEGISDGERILWPTKHGIAAGVFKITNQEVKVPMINNSEEPMILREGEEIGHWGTEKWREGIEDLRPLMMDSETHELTPEERRKVLHEQVRQSTGVDRLSEEVKNVLDEFPEAFSICDRELSKTDSVVDSQPYLCS